MTKSWLSPEDISSTAGEPFLRLPAPHQNIVITPPREGDDEHLLTLFGDISVAHCFHTIPIPFCRDHSQAMFSQAKEEADGLLDELRTAKESPGKQWKVVGGCPLKYIREVQESGADVFIGRIWVGRDQYEDVFGKAERRAAVEENDARPVGDPSIRWTIGVALAPSHQGQGIMTSVVHQLLHSWLVPRMNVRYIVVYAFVENLRSVRVFEKNGFTKVAVLQDEEYIVRGERRSLTMLEWRFRGDSSGERCFSKEPI